MTEIPFGRCVTEEELRKIFPEDEYFGEVVRRQLDQGITWYKQLFKEEPNLEGSKVAYECGNCRRIIVGSPKLNVADFSSSRNVVVLKRCNYCNNLVDAIAFP